MIKGGNILFVLNWIDKAEVNHVPLLIFGIGLVAFVFCTKTPHGGIAYRGLAYYIYGKKAWYLSNKLGGAFLMFFSSILFLIFKIVQISNDIKVAIVCLTCFFSLILTDVSVIIYLKKKEK